MSKRSAWPTLAGIASLGALAVLLSLLLLRVGLQHMRDSRGVATGALPAVLPWRSSGLPYGINTALHQDAANLARSLDLVQGGGFHWLRQRFPWAEIEPQPGLYRWDEYDRIVQAAGERGLRLIAVLDTSPAWARSSALDSAPPDDIAHYANFVAAFAAHYRGRVEHIQIWDQPNVAPHWGEHWASPQEYTAMLRLAYERAKAANPAVTILAAALAPTTADDQWNLNDITFLRRMYIAGARGCFDVLAAKAYGFWTGPDDRRTDPAVLNFSRVLLLRDVMVKNGDARLPVWIVEMGWNALPADWRGKPAPWGTDREEVQARRTVDALHRAQSEWPWLDVMILNGLRFPATAPDDPIRGFALVDDGLSPRPIYRAVQGVTKGPATAGPGRYSAAAGAAAYSAGWQPVGPVEPSPLAFATSRAGDDLTFRFQGTGLTIYAAHGPGAGRLRLWLDGQATRLPRSDTGDIELTRSRDQGLMPIVVAAGLADGKHSIRLQVEQGLDGSTVTIGGFEVVRSVSYWRLYGLLAALAGGVLACLVGIARLMPCLPWAAWDTLAGRLPDTTLWLMMAAAVMVYYSSPWLPIAALGALAFGALAVIRLDMAVVLTTLTVPFYLYPKTIGPQAFSLPEVLVLLCAAAWAARGLGTRQWGRPGAFRLPVLAFVAVAVLSLAASDDLRLSGRELRTVVVEPAIFYVLAAAAFGGPARRLPRSALAWALVLAGTTAAGQALLQYTLTGHVITAEGVRRALGPYGSPNNLGLLLERMLPVALALFLRSRLPSLTPPDIGGRHRAVTIPPRRRETSHSTSYLSISLLAAGCLAVMAVALLLTYSVGAWLGAVAGMLLFAALRGRRQVMMLAVALALALVVLLPILRVERVVSHLDVETGATTSIRLDLWRSSLAMLADHPLQGVGLDGFLERYREQYIRPSALREPGLSHPHNLMLEWWLFLGILGVPLLLWLLAGFFRRGWRLLREMTPADALLVQGAMAGMAGAITHGLVDRFYFGAPDLAYVFFALLALL